MTATMTTATRYDNAAAAVAAGAPLRLSNDCGSRPTGSVPDAAGTGDRPLAPAIRPVGVATVTDLLRQRAELPAGHPDRAALRARSIEAGLPLARSWPPGTAVVVNPSTTCTRSPPSPWSRPSTATTPIGRRRSPPTPYPHRRRAQAPLPRHHLAGPGATTHPGTSPHPRPDQRRTRPTARPLTDPAGTRRPPRHRRADITIALNAWQAHHPDSLDALSATGGDEPTRSSRPSAASTPASTRSATGTPCSHCWPRCPSGSDASWPCAISPT